MCQGKLFNDLDLRLLRKKDLSDLFTGSIATYELVETDLSFLTKWTYDCVAYCEGKTEYRWRAKECEELGRWHYICDQGKITTYCVTFQFTAYKKTKAGIKCVVQRTSLEK